MDPLTYLGYIAVLLITGIIITYFSYKIKISNVLLLITVGILLNYTPNPIAPEEQLMNFDPYFLTGMGILALAIIVFESASHFRLKEVDSVSSTALKITLTFTFLTVVLLTPLTKLFFNELSWPIILIFTTAMCGTSPDVVLSAFKKNANKIIKTLEVESIVNTPLNVLLPFLVVDFLNTTSGKGALVTLFGRAILMKVIAGIGTGVLFGIILLKVMKKNQKKRIAPVILLATALATYILAERLEGNGVLAVTVLGLIFGNSFLKHKTKIANFSSVLSISLEILVFILIGFLINIPFNITFWVKVLGLFALYLFIRWIALNISLHKGNETAKEKLFMALNAPKGIAVAVVAFVLSMSNIPGIQSSLDLILSFLLISIIVSTIAIKFSNKFFELKNVEAKTME
jgi:cell volume regulation protein A